MEGDFNNIDNLIRDKFDDFSPTPPAHIWEGIEKGIESKPAAIFFNKTRTTTAAVIAILALIGSLVVWNNFDDNQPIDSNTIEIENTIAIVEPPDVIEEEQMDNISPNEYDAGIPQKNNGAIVIPEGDKPEKKKLRKKKKSISITKPVSGIGVEPVDTISEIKPSNSIVRYYMSTIDLRESYTITTDDRADYHPINGKREQIQNNNIELDIPTMSGNSSWKTGLYISPELTISNIDSVEILNSYNINIEPTYFFNDHWFIRSGIGLSFTRDRGFAKIEYVVKEYMGSYDDVYDITFDTVAGNVTPVYHTKTVEVWDTVNHISVSDITNSYLYLQIPALFGYSNNVSGSPVSWYVFGGPAINFKTSSWIEEPLPDEDDADIVELRNNLPIRADNYFQLWLGAGLEYELNKTLSFAVEPGYRHYLSNIYTNTDIKGPSSGFTLRVGLVYKMK